MYGECVMGDSACPRLLKCGGWRKTSCKYSWAISYMWAGTALVSSSEATQSSVLQGQCLDHFILRASCLRHSSGSGGTWLVAMLLWASKSVVGNCLKHVLAHGAPKTLFYNGSSVDVFPEVSNASLGAKQRSMLICLRIDMSSFEKGLPYQTLQADTIGYLPSKSGGGAWWRSARKPFLVAAFDRSLILIPLPVLEIWHRKRRL